MPDTYRQFPISSPGDSLAAPAMLAASIISWHNQNVSVANDMAEARHAFETAAQTAEEAWQALADQGTVNWAAAHHAWVAAEHARIDAALRHQDAHVDIGWPPGQLDGVYERLCAEHGVAPIRHEVQQYLVWPLEAQLRDRLDIAAETLKRLPVPAGS